MKTKTLLGLLIALVFAGCEKDDPKPVQQKRTFGVKVSISTTPSAPLVWGGYIKNAGGGTVKTYKDWQASQFGSVNDTAYTLESSKFKLHFDTPYSSGIQAVLTARVFIGNIEYKQYQFQSDTADGKIILDGEIKPIN